MRHICVKIAFGVWACGDLCALPTLFELLYLSLLWKLQVESSNSLAVLYCRRPSFSFIVRGGLARRSSLVRFIIPGLLPASGSDDLVPSLKEVLRILFKSTSFMMLKEHS